MYIKKCGSKATSDNDKYVNNSKYYLHTTNVAVAWEPFTTLGREVQMPPPNQFHRTYLNTLGASATTTDILACDRQLDNNAYG